MTIVPKTFVYIATISFALNLFAQETQPSASNAAVPTPVPQEQINTPKNADPAVKEKTKEGGFTFGSYGRVQAATDCRGGEGRNFNIVSHGPRLTERSYLELEFRYDWAEAGIPPTSMISTIAINDPLFHYDRDFNSIIAVRNLFLEMRDVIVPRLGFWAGSRMYRGDDIYLLDFWPLDNLNTYGGGIFYELFDTEIAWHAGVSRKDDYYQTQKFAFTAPVIGAEEVLYMNRQRYITSLKATHFFLRGIDGIGLKLKLYGEFHFLDDAQILEDFETKETMPSDSGTLVGFQVGSWNFGPHSFVNLFMRYATGLAAYGEDTTPFGLSQDKTTSGATELLSGISANYEYSFIGLVAGGYFRKFTDADKNDDSDDRNEFVVALRPHIFLHKNFYQAFEFSYQLLNLNGPWPETNQTIHPKVTTIAAIPTLTLGGGTYGRPVLRFVFAALMPNDSARVFFLNPNDPRSSLNREYFLGIGAEWWFNSSSYQ